MLSCWEKEADERPKFSNLVMTVSSLLERSASYLELSFCTTFKNMDTISPTPFIAHPEIEMAVLEPEVEEKEDISDDMQGSSSPFTGSQ